MKSAYELAMERLQQDVPSMVLTDEQKERIAEIDSTCKARIAEKELSFKDRIRKAEDAGKLEEAESLQQELTGEIRRAREECEEKKANLRNSFVN